MRTVREFSPNLCAITDRGCRPRNEDAFGISQDGRLWVVADGMGGAAGGDIASGLCVDVATAFATKNASDRAGQTLERAVQAAHEAVLGAARKAPQYEGMGATLILAAVLGNALSVCHVGDTRCYVRSQGALERLTRDHSLVAQLIEAGRLSPELARIHPRRNEILQAVGVEPGIEPDLAARELNAGDRVLLCSDGLWGAMEDSEILALLGSDGTMRQVAVELVDRALANGAGDNITLVLYEHAAC